MKRISEYLDEIGSNIRYDDVDFINANNGEEYVIEKLKHLIINDFKNEEKNARPEEGEIKP